MTVRSDVIGMAFGASGAGVEVYAALDGETVLIKDWCLYNASGSSQAAELFFDVAGTEVPIWRGLVPATSVVSPEFQRFLVMQYPVRLMLAGNVNHTIVVCGARLEGEAP